MKTTRRGFVLHLSLVLGLVIIAVVIVGLRRLKPDTPEAKVVFSQPMFDRSKISYITPLGEVNGGYAEVQTLSGLMIWNKPEAVANGQMVEVYAPTAMTLDSYSYRTELTTNNTDWALIFQINKDAVLKFDHVTEASAKIQAATTTTPATNSRELKPKQPVTVEAGEMIARTRGTNQAKNWNIYLYDQAVQNTFVNQARYEDTIGQRLAHGACVFTYYNEAARPDYQSLMGATAAGQSSGCGRVSHDQAGTLSGLWYFDADPTAGTKEQQDGVFASPFSVYKDSAGQVIIHQLAGQRFDLPSALDPSQVTTEHCYPLASANKTAGYVYFKLISESEMRLAYAPSGACPAAFPAAKARTYYR